MGHCCTKKLVTQKQQIFQEEERTSPSEPSREDQSSFLRIGTQQLIIEPPESVKRRLESSGMFQPVRELYQSDNDHRFQRRRCQNNCVYFGELNEQLERHGIGKCIWLNGFYLEGSWKSDKACGSCRLIYPSGDMFEGEMLQYRAQGKGKFYTDQHITEGFYVNNQLNGFGTQVMTNGDSYEGEFRNNSYNGKGILMRKGRGQFEGQFKNGQKHGHGKITYSDGEVMLVEFNKDLIDGFGCCGSLIGSFIQLTHGQEKIKIQCTKLDGTQITFERDEI